MSQKHTIQPGDCIASLAFENGLFPATIWNHAENALLRNKCQNMYQLISGEEVFIPEKTLKEVDKPTDAKHVFKRRGLPEIYRVRLLDGKEQPRRNLQYVLVIDGSIHQGVTDSQGYVIAAIPPNAVRGELKILDGELEEVYALNLGHIQPVTEIEGLQARLSNLGYSCLDEKGEMGELTRRCLSEFQLDYNLEPTGEPDAQTRQMLVQAYGG